MLYQSPQHYIVQVLEPQLKEHADEYDLDQVAYEMLLWCPGSENWPSGWFEDSTENLVDVLGRNTIDD